MKTFLIAAAGAAIGTFAGCTLHKATMVKASTLHDFGVCEPVLIGTEHGPVQVLDCNMS